jgi:hypothetical protein
MSLVPGCWNVLAMLRTSPAKRGRSRRSCLILRWTLILGLMALPALGLPASAQGQVSSLIKKKFAQATAKVDPTAPTAAPPTFDDVTLELTQPRVAKIIAGKQAGKRIAEGPNGPAAIRAKTEALDARQAAIYKKHVDEINAWDEKRREVQNCRDSALSAIKDRRRNELMGRAQSDPQYRLRLADLARAMMEAQQKGDTAATRKAREAMDNLKAPSKADTAQAMSQCGEAGPTGLVKEWVELKSQLEELQGLEQQAEVAIQQAEQSESGMTNRQLAVACERIKLFADRLKKKAKMGEFTEQEQQALQQAIKDLEELCG